MDFQDVRQQRHTTQSTLYLRALKADVNTHETENKNKQKNKEEKCSVRRFSPAG